MIFFMINQSQNCHKQQKKWLKTFPRAQRLVYIMNYNEECQILTFQKLEPTNVWCFRLNYDWNYYYYH